MLSSKGSLGQSVEEGFLGIAIVLKRFVIVEVVACEIGKYAAYKAQTANTLLVYGV